ncbi:CNNM domain-containing protein [Moritella sp. Urea-trap-13]|uniref:CNNM domain-containing protein n=1 Tax=Moritella sp. Urea-trap-13 TaxID=2058327 RepID=UPI000C34DDFA|nr:CNNM domain-containing protein [Moritella sp. Urea-trap-13]PKH04867.1 hemolysin [Moritella sp. Urea-trap-13]
MTLLIIYAVISIVVSFICSILEASLLSMTPSYIARMQREDPKLATKLAKLKDNLDRPLAAILTLNTVAHTAGAAGVGAQVTAMYGSAYLGIASAVMTVLILVLSEIIPKTMGATYWRQLAPSSVTILNTMIFCLKPFIFMSEQITRRIGKGHSHDIDMREEIIAMAHVAKDTNEIDDDESRVICNILDLHNVKVKDIMTPRGVVSCVAADMNVSDFEALITNIPFSRLPLLTDDEFFGYVHKSDILHHDGDTKLLALAKPLEVYLPTQNAEHVFNDMLRSRNHLASIHDELGTWLGIITMEDILETILGREIVDESDTSVDMRKIAKAKWQKRLAK